MRVKTEQISPIIKRFIDNHNAEHPQRMGGNNNHNATQHTPVVMGREYICKRTGLGVARVQSIIDCKNETIPFKFADQIMCAIERQDVFVNGEVEILEDVQLAFMPSGSFID